MKTLIIKKKRGGWKLTDETRQKMSVARMGEKNWATGKHLSEITKEKLRQCNLGKKQTVEAKIKQIKAQIGKKMPESSREKSSLAKMGIKNPMFGKKLTLEHRMKISKASKGEKGNNWQGGLTKKNYTIRRSLELKLWREAVFERDNYTCQKTGNKKEKLNSHHIQNFSSHPELRTAIDNGITLSKSAHELFHKIYGRRNNTREQLNEFINNKNI